VGTIATRRDFIDVRDVARAYVALATADVPCDADAVYNACTGRSVSIEECLNILAGFARVPVQVVQDPDRVRVVDIPEQTGTAARLHAATGWTPVIGLEESLADLMRQARGER
jgi:GDP-4-dehydro-6-deoxy-D-mannose reductase